MSTRICCIRHSDYPEELSVRRELETLARAGYETHIICLASEQPAEPARQTVGGVEVHRLPLSRKKGSLLRYLYDYLSFFLLAACKVSLLHLRRPFAAIQVNTMPDFLVFAALIPKLLGARVVVMMHEPVPELWETLRGKPAPKIIALAEQWALAWVDAACTVTQQLKDAYVRRGADAGKITVILNVPESRFLAAEGALNKRPENDGRFIVVCHGAIEERYGHDTMLDALALIGARIPGLRLRILGQGSYCREFLEKVREMGLEGQVDFLGYVSLRHMIEELHNADAGIVAQKSSPYSNLVQTNKMYEFIELGKPVLASRLKAVAAYFHDDALQYFEPGDPRSLAEALVDLYRRPERRGQLVANAAQLYDQYRWERQSRLYLGVYQRLLDVSPAA